MPESSLNPSNPKRIAAGKKNWLKRKGFTAQGLERLREAALRNKPWRKSSGPRTAEGKAKSAANGRVRQTGPRSIRQLRADVAELDSLVGQMRETRELAESMSR
jgi:hypothetical protein